MRNAHVPRIAHTKTAAQQLTLKSAHLRYIERASTMRVAVQCAASVNTDSNCRNMLSKTQLHQRNLPVKIKMQRDKLHLKEKSQYQRVPPSFYYYFISRRKVFITTQYQHAIGGIIYVQIKSRNQTVLYTIFKLYDAHYKSILSLKQCQVVIS